MAKKKKLDPHEIILREGSRIYRWLWWSPILTVPTAAVLLFSFYPGYGYPILISALWHALFLRKAFVGKHDPFVKWHARQALLLAGIRTLIAFAFVSTDTFGWLFVLIALWFFGNIWAGSMAKRGDCWLWGMWNAGEFQEFEKATVKQIHAETPKKKPESTKIEDPNAKIFDQKTTTQVQYGRQKTVETLLAAFRGGKVEQRNQALAQLEAMGEIEVFKDHRWKRKNQIKD